MMQNTDLRRGLVHGIPIALGYFSVSFAFGIFSVEQGLAPLEALLISMTCLTSAGQLAAVPIIAGSGSLAELALSQLVINLRYSLMSVSLSQKLDRDVKVRNRLAIAFMNTDEIFAVASGQPGPVSKQYMLGLAAAPWLGWTGGTILGALAGNILPELVTASLGVAIYGMFIAIVVPQSKSDRAMAGCVGVSLVLSCLMQALPLLRQIPSGFAIILCSVLASGLFALIAPIGKEESCDA